MPEQGVGETLRRRLGRSGGLVVEGGFNGNGVGVGCSGTGLGQTKRARKDEGRKPKREEDEIAWEKERLEVLRKRKQAYEQ